MNLNPAQVKWKLYCQNVNMLLKYAKLEKIETIKSLRIVSTALVSLTIVYAPMIASYDTNREKYEKDDFLKGFWILSFLKVEVSEGSVPIGISHNADLANHYWMMFHKINKLKIH